MGSLLPYYLAAQHIYSQGTKNNIHPQLCPRSVVKWKLDISGIQDIINIEIASLTIVHNRKAIYLSIIFFFVDGPLTYTPLFSRSY